MSNKHPAGTSVYSTWTEDEIRQQPACWRQVLDDIRQYRSTIEAFLAAVLAQRDLNIILTGAGTSAFIGEVIAPWLARHTGINIRAIASTDIVSNPREYLPAHRPLLLISFARSGNSPESVATMQLAEQCVAHCHHLVITCHQDGMLNRQACQQQNALSLLMPAAAHDRGFAMTSSASSMMLCCLAVLASSRIHAESFGRVMQCAEQVIQAHGHFRHSLFGEAPCKRVVYLGSGGLSALAREAALKVLELTAGKLAAFYDSPLGFRHGPKSIVDSETLVIVFISSDSYTRRYDLDFLAELRRDQQALSVVALANRPDPVIDAGPHHYLPAADGLQDVELAFCYLIYAQIFALYQSIQAGITPDTPSASGTVNRVVKGVAIHPYAQHSGA